MNRKITDENIFYYSEERAGRKNIMPGEENNYNLPVNWLEGYTVIFSHNK